MAINSIWVFAQTAGGAPTTGTLELLTKARALSSNVSAFIGGDASAVAGALGSYRRWRFTIGHHVPAELRRSRRYGSLVGEVEPHRHYEQHRHRRFG